MGGNDTESGLCRRLFSYDECEDRTVVLGDIPAVALFEVPCVFRTQTDESGVVEFFTYCFDCEKVACRAVEPFEKAVYVDIIQWFLFYVFRGVESARAFSSVGSVSAAVIGRSGFG